MTTLQVGDRRGDFLVDDAVSEGADYEIELALYDAPASATVDCKNPVLGPPRNLSSYTLVEVDVRAVGTDVSFRGTASFIAVGSATSPARVRVAISRDEIDRALAVDGAFRSLIWTVYATNSAFQRIPQTGGTLEILDSGAGGA